MSVALAVNNDVSLVAMEAEQALLGAILMRNDIYFSVSPIVRPESFYEPIHQRIFQKVKELVEEGRVANPITLRSYLPEELQIGKLTVAEYLSRLIADTPSLTNGPDFAAVIRESAMRRRMVSVGETLTELARDPSLPVPRGVKDVMTDLSAIDAEVRGTLNKTHLSSILDGALANLTTNLQAGTAMDWCLPEITDVVGMMRPGNLIGFMSDSGGGKTSLALQQCYHSAEKATESGETCPTAFFSIEVTDEEAALQIACQRLSIQMDRMDRLDLSNEEQEALGAEIAKIKAMPLHICTFAQATLEEIRGECLRMVRQYQVRLVLIDHAKFIELPGSGRDLFAERVNAMYRGLKTIAKDLKIAIVILIQRNDGWKERMKRNQSARPIDGDAYGGGSVKQSLDAWFSLYRPEPLYEDALAVMPTGEKKDAMRVKLDDVRGKAWVINHKRRRGNPRKSEMIRFVPEFTRFESMRPDIDQEDMGL